jgi:two-component system, cell cycle sensor histidine kinase and response regulator CckA
LSESNQQRKLRLEALGRLSSLVAHDFNNLLTVIEGNARLLADNAALTPESREHANDIIRAAEQAASLSHQLLLFSRGGQNPSELLPLSQLLQNMRSLLRSLAGPRCSVSVFVEDDTLQIVAQRTWIEQALQNLVVNASKAMPQGGEIQIALRRSGQDVELSVTDHGAGISDDVRERIFEPFFTTRAMAGGSGLGLAIVQQAVEEAHGRIEVISQPERGSTFRLLFPAAAARPIHVEAPAPAAAASTANVIFLVEDEPAVRSLMTRVLNNAGYSVLSCSSLAECRALIDDLSLTPLLLLADMVLSDGTGQDVQRVLERRYPAVPVLYISGYGDLPGVPPENLLQKPFPPRMLLERVREKLSLRSAGAA